jgi:hypothetical protein
MAPTGRLAITAAAAGAAPAAEMAGGGGAAASTDAGRGGARQRLEQGKKESTDYCSCQAMMSSVSWCVPLVVCASLLRLREGPLPWSC